MNSMDTTPAFTNRIAAWFLGTGGFAVFARFVANTPAVATTAITSII